MANYLFKSFNISNIESILVIITIILSIIITASAETAILKSPHPPVSATFVDSSILRRKRLEANAAAVRQHLQHQRDVQVENVGGLLGPLPAINTVNDATGRQPLNNLQPVLAEQQNQQQSVAAPANPSLFPQQPQVFPPSSTPPEGYQIQQSTEIYARLGQQQHVSVASGEDNYQTVATSVAPLPPDNAITSGYENVETPPSQLAHDYQNHYRTKRIKRTAPPQQKQSQALLRCLREAAIIDSLGQHPRGPEPPVRAKARSPSHRVNVDIAPQRINNERHRQNRVHGHRIQQAADHEYASASLHPPSIHPPPTFHGGQQPHGRPGHSQFFVPASTQGGADYVHHQHQFVQVQPHGEGEHGGGTPQGVGFLSGSAKGSNLPTQIGLGQKGAHRYYYPPRIPLPLPTCFHNPTGYPCCNPIFLKLKIHFAGDLVCKVELGGKYMLAYATVKDVSRVLVAEPGDQQQQNEVGTGAETSGASNNISGKRRKRQSDNESLENSVYGPQMAKPSNDLSRHYSMWV
uniref:Uncharacterized protein n=1 Tax=Meloidogyne hapla TaxID=6305 RepID=A0A1I8C1M4_MELHA